jgi:hypothetical protein
MQSKSDNGKGTEDYAAVTFTSSSGDFIIWKLNVTARATAKSPFMKFVFDPQTRKTRAEYDGKDYCAGKYETEAFSETIS